MTHSGVSNAPKMSFWVYTALVWQALSLTSARLGWAVEVFACLWALGLAPGLRDGASAALACDDGRPGGCSAPGQALAHGYRADPGRQSAPRWPCLLPQAPNGRLRSALLRALGMRALRAPKLPPS